jgi:HNH endonuclease
MTERWKATRYEGYDVSSAGRVRSWVKPGRARYTGPRDRPYILAQYPSEKGYMRVSLRRPGQAPREVFVTVLVLETFVGKRPTPSSQARHLDSNQKNNRLRNLRWGTPIENASDKCRSGVGCAKLTMHDREVIARSTAPTSELAHRYDVHRSTIHRIRGA